MTNRIKDDSGDRKYWVQTPMLIWALAQDPYELALWFTIKAVAGEDRECTLSTEDLATLSMMSTGKVSQCRSRLIELGLLQGEFRKDPDYPQPVWHLTIPDIWETNVAWAKANTSIKARIEHKSLQRSEVQKQRSAVKSLHQVKDTPKEPSPGEGGVTPGEGGVTPGEGGVTPGEGGVTPGEGGVTPGEGGVTPGEANKIIYRIDLDQTKIIEEGARVSDPEPAPPPTPPTAPPSKAKLLPNDSYDVAHRNGSSSPSPSSGGPLPEMERALIVTSKRGRPNANSLTPHVKGAQFGKDDLVMEETGTNPVAIYYEFYSIYDHKLAARVEDDLARVVTDLDHWREVVRVWQSCGHKPSNVNGMRDWYRDPSRIPGGQPVNGHTSGSSRKESVNGNGKYSGNGVHSPATKPADNDANRRQREYNERYTSLLADEINGVIPKDEAAKLWEQIDREFPDFQYREVR